MNVVPGDYLVAKRAMRSWEALNEKGDEGQLIVPGDQALTLSCHNVGSKVRLVMVVNDKIVIMSSRLENLAKNWDKLNTEPALTQTSDP